MPLPFHLGLRDRRHMVSVIRSDGRAGTRDVLGMAYPQDMNPRLRILEQWGMTQASPRLPMPATVDIPLPRRHQVALSARINPELQASLRGGFTSQPVGRLETMQGVKSRLHLGRHHTPISNGLPPASHGGAARSQPASKPSDGHKAKTKR